MCAYHSDGFLVIQPRSQPYLIETIHIVAAAVVGTKDTKPRLLKIIRMVGAALWGKGTQSAYFAVILVEAGLLF